jgi:hypothetical protein
MKSEKTFMSRFLVFAMVIMCAAISVSAQTEKNGKRGRAAAEIPTNPVDLNGPEQTEQNVSTRRISYEYAAPTSKKIGVIRVGSPTTYLKEGLTTTDVIQVLGEPAAVSTRVEKGNVVTTYEFQRGGERIFVAEFVKDRLVRTRTETRDQLAQKTR